MTEQPSVEKKKGFEQKLGEWAVKQWKSWSHLTRIYFIVVVGLLIFSLLRFDLEVTVINFLLGCFFTLWLMSVFQKETKKNE